MAIKFQGGKKTTKGAGSKAVKYGGGTTGGGSEALQNSWERREKAAADPYAIHRQRIAAQNQTDNRRVIRYNPNSLFSRAFDALGGSNPNMTISKPERRNYDTARTNRNAAPGSPLSWLNQIFNTTGVNVPGGLTPAARANIPNALQRRAGIQSPAPSAMPGPVTWKATSGSPTARSGYSNVSHDYAALMNQQYENDYGLWVTPTSMEARLRQNAAPIGYEWTPTNGWIPVAQGAQTAAAETPMDYAGYGDYGDYGYEDWPMDWGGGGGGGGYTYDPQTQSWYLNPYTWRI